MCVGCVPFRCASNCLTGRPIELRIVLPIPTTTNIKFFCELFHIFSSCPFMMKASGNVDNYFCLCIACRGIAHVSLTLCLRASSISA